jgi:DNA polymerase III epsilon subunit-like protein
MTTRYCSIDLELTGFDPLRDEILEVGFVFFTLGTAGVQIESEWSQVFKPHSEVHPKILGLTGITSEELQKAPAFSEFQIFLQQQLGDAILVGHNIVLDVRFLEAFGITLSGSTIDTLDLVQWMLPTHHSYNLENPSLRCVR